MIRARGTVQVRRSAEDCFDFIADLCNEPKFNPDASHIVKATDGPIGLGTVFTENVKPLGHFEVRIDEYERPRLLGFDARNARATIPVRFRFASVGSETRIDAEIELQLKGPLRLLEPVMRPLVSRMYERKRGPMLKRALEGASEPAA
jgi:Polyketide cyclase / dehydrase and lipid transport